jgi:dTDP-4-amino-4,6-dideoxygalactose transaminase
MPAIMRIAERHGLVVVEDACQSILGEIDGRRAGTWGRAGGFSLHPLKNLNVWGDGGVVVTDDDETARLLRLLRNHGMRNRDEIEILGCNSRLDSLQAIVGNWLIGSAGDITARRIENAAYYDEAFADSPGIRIPPRRPNVRRVFHLYMVFAELRDELYDFLLSEGVEAKIHYPIPLYQQDALKLLGYRAGQFPVTDRHAGQIITFPTDQHLSREQQDIVVETVRRFYGC